MAKINDNQAATLIEIVQYHRMNLAAEDVDRRSARALRRRGLAAHYFRADAGGSYRNWEPTEAGYALVRGWEVAAHYGPQLPGVGRFDELDTRARKVAEFLADKS